MTIRSIIVAALAFTSGTIAGEAQFIPIEPLLGDLDTTGAGLSADGRFAVGMTGDIAGFQQGFWLDRESGQMVGIGYSDLPDSYPVSTSWGVSDDGTLVACIGFTNPPYEDIPSRWTMADGMIDLGHLPGYMQAGRATAVSGDGTTIVGYSRLNQSVLQTFRWTQDEGMVGLGFIIDDGYSIARAVSPDGSVIVGQASVNEGGYANIAFRWTAAKGYENLGDLPEGTKSSDAYGVSPDGSVVVGEGTVGGGEFNARGEAFRWTAAGGMEALGWMQGGEYSRAVAASQAGRIIVGHGKSDSAHTWYGYEAFIWDQEHGIRSLRDTLVGDYGLGAALDGWVLSECYAITPDGRFISGTGLEPGGRTRAWIVDLGGGACYADFTGDGALDLFDFLEYVNAFNSGKDAADCDGNGVLDLFDFLCFVNAFNAGC